MKTRNAPAMSPKRNRGASNNALYITLNTRAAQRDEIESRRQIVHQSVQNHDFKPPNNPPKVPNLHGPSINQRAIDHTSFLSSSTSTITYRLTDVENQAQTSNLDPRETKAPDSKPKKQNRASEGDGAQEQEPGLECTQELTDCCVTTTREVV